MRCPFLREEQVKSCRAVPFRKPFSRSALRGTDERCSSPAHVACPVAAQSREAHPAPGHCPFLHESLAQFCAAAPLPAYVPWSESPDVPCGNDGHRFCEHYLAVAGAAGRGPAQAGAERPGASIPEVEGLPMPAWLHYAPNHLWLDVGADGRVHLGIDAFLARRVGTAEGLRFLGVKGLLRPTVVVTARGAELVLAFPRPLLVVAANTRLRACPQRLTADPYGSGWLFEAQAVADAALLGGLLHGEAARAWMAREVRGLAPLGRPVPA